MQTAHCLGRQSARRRLLALWRQPESARPAPLARLDLDQTARARAHAHALPAPATRAPTREEAPPALRAPVDARSRSAGYSIAASRAASSPIVERPDRR